MTYKIIATHPHATGKRGSVMDKAEKLTDANKAVHHWQTYLGTEWRVKYRIVREKYDE